MLQREVGESLHMNAAEQLLRHSHEPVRARTCGSVERAHEVLGALHFEKLQLHAESTGGRLQALELTDGDRVGRIVEHGHPRESRKSLLEQFQSLAAEL